MDDISFTVFGADPLALRVLRVSHACLHFTCSTYFPWKWESMCSQLRLAFKTLTAWITKTKTIANSSFTEKINVYLTNVVCYLPNLFLLWQVFPLEILQLVNLVSLKLRNNPIKQIPYGKQQKIFRDPVSIVLLKKTLM